MIHEFNSPISVETPLGHGYAIFVEINNDDYFWTIGLDSRAIVTFTQNKIRLSRCYTLRRGITDNQMKAILNGKANHSRATSRKRK